MEALLIIVLFIALAVGSAITDRRQKRDPLTLAANQALHDLRIQVRRYSPQSLSQMKATPPVGVPVIQMPDIEERTRKVASVTERKNGSYQPPRKGAKRQGS